LRRRNCVAFVSHPGYEFLKDVETRAAALPMKEDDPDVRRCRRQAGDSEQNHDATDDEFETLHKGRPLIAPCALLMLMLMLMLMLIVPEAMGN
jgi:hypothetical protein